MRRTVGAVVGTGLLVAIVVTIAAVTTSYTRSAHQVHHVKDELTSLHMSFMLWNMKNFEHLMINVGRSGGVELEPLTPTLCELIPDDARDNLESFEKKWNRAKRRIELDFKGGAWRRYRRDYLHIVDDTEMYAKNGTAAWIGASDRRELFLAYHASLVEFEDELHENDSEHLTILVWLTSTTVAFSVMILLVVMAISFHALQQTQTSELAVQERDAFFDGCGVPAFIIDDQNLVADCNAAVCSTFGFAKADLVGHNLDLALPELLSTGTTVEDDGERQTETYGRNKRGGQIKLVVSAQPSILSRIPTTTTARRYTTIFCQDVSELKAKQAEVDTQKRVLSQLSHEIRNKLGPAQHQFENIRSFVMDASKSDFDVRSALTEADDDIRRSVALLREADQLVATRVQYHKIFKGNYRSEPNVQTVDLVDVIQARLDAAAALSEDSLAFLVDVSLEETTTTKKDETDQRAVIAKFDTFIFEHIANNLISNARKHTASPGTITMKLVDHSNDQLTFAVTDTGRGVPPAMAPKLFQDEVTSGDARGVGIGLLSCRVFAEAVGGRCWLERTKLRSEEDPVSGSEFRFSLPGHILPEDLHRSFVANQLPQTPATKRLLPVVATFYIVDDSPLVRKHCAAKLSAASKRVTDEHGRSVRAEWTFHHYETAEALLNVLDSIRRDTSAVVTVDESLESAGGHLSGSDLITALRRGNFQGFIVSASGDDDAQADHLEKGAHAVFGKPLPNVDTIVDILINLFATLPNRATVDSHQSSSPKNIASPPT